MSVPTPGLELERAFQAGGLVPVAGLDEAGRGAWAGPVSAAAVILPLERDDLPLVLDGVRDSKLCTPRQREALVPAVLGVALAAAVGFATAREIEQIGIVPATYLAMRRALEALPVAPRALLIDGRYMRLKDVGLPQKSLSRGEQHSLSIAAASILAKVARDHWMVEADQAYPGYGFALHKGYGTRLHRRALAELGVCDLHRRTFAPVAIRLAGGEGHEDRAGA